MGRLITEEVIARQTPEAQAIIRALLARIAALEAEVEALRRQMQGKTPQNSSVPPSSQHPHAKPERNKQKSKKKRGGQVGHPKHERPLIPTEDCDHVEPLRPDECVDVAKSFRAAILSRCGIRFGNCPTSNRRSPSTSGAVDMSPLWGDDLCGTAPGCHGASRAHD